MDDDDLNALVPDDDYHELPEELNSSLYAPDDPRADSGIDPDQLYHEGWQAATGFDSPRLHARRDDFDYQEDEAGAL
jgi:hypothetical protein